MRKKIPGFEEYTVDRKGVVRRNGRIKKNRLIRLYHYVDLSNRGVRKNARVCRLVATAFVPNPENKPQVNHKNFNRLDDRAENLEWVTSSENHLHAREQHRKNGTYKTPRGNRKFPEGTVQKVFVLRDKGLLHREIAKKLGMGVSTVTHMLLGTRRYEQYQTLIDEYTEKSSKI